MKAIIPITLAALGLAGCAAPLQVQLDEEVRRLCAIDGGIRVYETVKLPAERFDQWGQVNFYRPTQKENALGPEYVFQWDLQYIRTGEPSLHRSHRLVLRRSDGKLLGESIGYSRGGGDLPGPWQPSSFSCPEEYGDIPLLMKIFVNKD